MATPQPGILAAREDASQGEEEDEESPSPLHGVHRHHERHCTDPVDGDADAGHARIQASLPSSGSPPSLLRDHNVPRAPTLADWSRRQLARRSWTPRRPPCSRHQVLGSPHGPGRSPRIKGWPLPSPPREASTRAAGSRIQRGSAPRPAAAHVRIVEDQVPTEPVTEDASSADERDPEKSEPNSATDGPERNRVSGFHVRAVPIDQPIDQPIDD